jgi:Putative transposase
VAVAAEDRQGLERLCRYGLWPSFALERLSLLDDGRVCYRLKRPWSRPGGITELVLEPVDSLASHRP